MQVILILAVVLGVAVGVGFTTWQLSRHHASRYVWVVDAAEDLSELEKRLNHFSEKGFGIHRGTEHPAFVIVGRRAEHTLPESSWI